ncbi:MAG TPA: hypothetical protein VGO63_04105 [Candidatus Paceibacterota bacterium]|nr:hypothetical protein [Candidatus Paceibacterota bacterium]
MNTLAIGNTNTNTLLPQSVLNFFKKLKSKIFEKTADKARQTQCTPIKRAYHDPGCPGGGWCECMW